MVETGRRTVLKRIGAGTALVLSGTGTVAAGGHGAGGAGDDEAALRVAHASPDAPAVDVLVNGARAVTDLEFRSVTEYLELPAGEYEIAVNVAGTDTTVFGPVSLELAAEDYTAVARGEVTSEDAKFTVSLYQDTNGADLADDEARVRAIHASPDAPAVDVTVNDGAPTLFDGVAFGESSGYAIVPAGTYSVEVRPDTAGDDGTVVSEAEVTLEGGSTYTVFALGYLTPDDEPADEAFGLLPTVDATAPPRRGRGGDDEDDEEEREQGEPDGDRGRRGRDGRRGGRGGRGRGGGDRGRGRGGGRGP